VAGPEWQVHLGDDADRDFDDILDWTARTFGPGQKTVYADAIAAAIRMLAGGPDAPSAKQRSDIMPGVWTLRVGAIRPRARHFLLYEVTGPRTIRVLRILHDNMDLQRHLSDDVWEADP